MGLGKGDNGYDDDEIDAKIAAVEGGDAAPDWVSRVAGATNKQTKVIIDSNTKSQESTFRGSQQWKLDIKSPKSSKFYSESSFTNELASQY